jgi:hypothetical protein
MRNSWTDRRLLRRQTAAIVTVACVAAVAVGIAGRIAATVYLIGIAALALAIWAWRSPRISKKQ